MRLLIVRLGALGDLVHALPVVAALRERHPAARIDWLVDLRHAKFLEMVPAVSRVVAVDSRRGSSLFGAVAQLRQEAYDVALDLQGLMKSAALARLSGARRVVGFPRAFLREKAASFFYTETCSAPAGPHVIDKNLGALTAFGLAPVSSSITQDPDGIPGGLQFPITAPPSAAADAVASLVVGKQAKGYVLINPGGGWPNKRWPAERFGEITKSLADRHGLLPVVLWGPGDQELARRIVETSYGAAVAAPPTGVADILALARAARLMVSGDTGPLHLAGAVGTPLVAVFGPTDPSRNGPWSSADISLSRFGDCLCHYRRRCRKSRPCIDDISAEDVSGAIDRRLAADPHA